MTDLNEILAHDRVYPGPLPAHYQAQLDRRFLLAALIVPALMPMCWARVSENEYYAMPEHQGIVGHGQTRQKQAGGGA